MSPDLHTLTGAYALDALDTDERTQFERHVAECGDCAREVSELRATATRLGSAAARTPPARLRASVLAEIVRTRQDSPSLRMVAAKRPRRWVVWGTSLAAAFALLTTGVVTGVAVDTHHSLQEAQTRLDQDQARYGPVAQLLAAPDLRTATDSIDGGTATVLTSHTLGRSVLVVDNMPAQPDGRTYQAWGISDTTVRSLGLLGNSGTATLTTYLGDTRTIGITVEPAGGSIRPTSVPIMTFPVPT